MNMPRIETEFRWEDKALSAGNKVRAGDEILVILEGFHIRDNKEWGSAEINVSLQVATKNSTKDITIGTFTGVKDNDQLVGNPIVLLPSTKIEDHLNISVDAMELDTAEGIFVKVPQIMEHIKKISEHVPIPGVPTVVKSASEIVASLVNIAGLINTDDTIIHNIASYVVDELKFPGLHDEFYLREGSLEVLEKKKIANPTKISFRIIKKSS